MYYIVCIRCEKHVCHVFSNGVRLEFGLVITQGNTFVNIDIIKHNTEIQCLPSVYSRIYAQEFLS